MPRDGLHGELGAGRCIPTGRRKKRAHRRLVEAKDREDHRFHGLPWGETWSRARATDPRSAAAVAAESVGRATRTRSSAGISDRVRRFTLTASRSRRRTRFRSTAPPTARPEETARRMIPCSFGRARSENRRSPRAEPSVRARVMSAERRNRAAITTCSAGSGDGEALATAEAARREHPTAARGAHPRAESVHPRAPTGLWLIRAFHNSSSSGIERSAEMAIRGLSQKSSSRDRVCSVLCAGAMVPPSAGLVRIPWARHDKWHYD